MDEIMKFKVRNPFTQNEVTVTYEPAKRQWNCSRCPRGPKCIHADAVVHTFEVEQIVEVSKKKVPSMPEIAENVDRSWEQESQR